MTGAFWEGLLAGYGIAIPVGAIAILIVDIGLRRGFSFSFMAGSGAAAADFLYAAMAAIAGEFLASALAPYSIVLRFASGLVLLALGGHGLWQARQLSVLRSSAVSAVSNRSQFQTFVQFLGLTLLNPLTIAYFGALILGRDSITIDTVPQRASFVAGAGLASLSWQTLLAAMGALAGQRLSPRFQRITSICGNLVVMGLGIRILILLSR
jgi:arginine exporter protein ArgO